MEGRIRVSRLDLASLCLDEDSNAFHHLMTLLGHTGPHVKLTRTVDGRGLLSTRPEEEAIAWMLTDDKTIRLRAVLAFKQPSLSLTLLAGNPHESTQPISLKVSTVWSCMQLNLSSGVRIQIPPKEFIEFPLMFTELLLLSFRCRVPWEMVK